jgi:hypothetical protein
MFDEPQTTVGAESKGFENDDALRPSKKLEL